MLVNKRGMFLVRLSLYNPSFCSDSTNTDSNCFLVKLNPLVKFIWSCMSVLSFVLIYVHCFFHNRWFWLRMCQTKKEIQFLFWLSLNAIKRLCFNADTEMFLALYSITINLYSNFFVFQYMHLCCVGTRHFVSLQLLFLYTGAILALNCGIIRSYVDCTGSPFCC